MRLQRRRAGNDEPGIGQSFAASRLACITLRSSSVSLTGDRLRVTRSRKVALAQVGAHRYVAPLVVLRATQFRAAPQTDQPWRPWQVRTFDAGGFRPSKGLKQGFFDGTHFYGEASSASSASHGPSRSPAARRRSGRLNQATRSYRYRPPSGPGPAFLVDTQESPPRLRSEPEISDPWSEPSMDDCGTAGSAALYARAYEVAHSSDRLNSARHEANGQPHMKLRFYCSFQTTENVDHASVSCRT